MGVVFILRNDTDWTASGKAAGLWEEGRINCFVLPISVEEIAFSLCLFAFAGDTKTPTSFLKRWEQYPYNQNLLLRNHFQHLASLSGREHISASNCVPHCREKSKRKQGGPCHHDRGVPPYVGVKQK